MEYIAFYARDRGDSKHGNEGEEQANPDDTDFIRDIEIHQDPFNSLQKK